MYRINYLVRQELDDTGGQPKVLTREVAYSETDIEIASCHWKAMGFKRVLDIKLIEGKNNKKPKYTEVDIIEMFYAPVGKVNGQPYEIEITTADLKVKSELLARFGKKPEKQETKQPEKLKEPLPVQENEPEWKKDKDLEKKYRKEILYPKLTKAGIKYSYNSKTEDLIAKLQELKIEI